MDTKEIATLPTTNNTEFQKLLNVDLKKLENPLLMKLIEEVRIEESVIDPTYYNRFHNRHNRS